MKIRELLRECLSVLSPRDRKILYLAAALQAALNIADVVAIALVGAIGALGVSYVSNLALPEWVSIYIKISGLSSLTTEQILIITSVIAAILFISKSISSSYISYRIFIFLANKQVGLSFFLSTKYIEAPFNWIKAQKSQNLIFSVTDGVNSIAIGIIGNFIIAISDFVLLLLILIALVFVDPSTAIFTLSFFGGTGYVLHKILGQISSRLGKVFSESSIKGRSQILNLISAYREIFVLRKATHFVTKFTETRLENATSYSLGIWLQQLPKYIFEVSLILGSIILIGLQALQNNFVGGVGVLVIFLAASARITPALMRVQISILQMKNHQAGANKTLKILQEMANFTTHNSCHLPTLRNTYPPEIHLRDVSFCYSDGLSKALKNISIRIAPGSMVAISGKSGSGKSTLVDLILGIQNPSEGRIWMEIEGKQINARDFVSAAYVPQFPHIIEGTLLDNIALGIETAQVDFNKVQEVIQSTNLASFVNGLSNGMYTDLGELGGKISGGERQRIAIARALYSNPTLLVLDEGTNALDAANENEILRTIQKFRNRITLILIAHTLKTLQISDKVVFLENGSLIGEDSFQTMYQNHLKFTQLVDEIIQFEE